MPAVNEVDSYDPLHLKNFAEMPSIFQPMHIAISLLAF